MNVSVIIPVKNEEKFIGGCIEQILSQTFSVDKLEILVVDGMSTDRTRDIVNEIILHNATPAKIRLIDNPKGQRASALNIGIRESTGQIVVRIDGRTIIGAEYIERCVQTLISTGADNVGGVQKAVTESEADILRTGSRTDGQNISDEGLFTQKAIGLALSHPFGVGDAQFRIGRRSGFVDTVYLGCFRREIFDRVGLFDEDSTVLSEDSDMNQRIRRAGGKVYLNKDIEAYYIPRDRISEIWNLYFRYGGAKAGNLLKNRMLTAWRQAIPPLFLLSIVFLPVFAVIYRPFLYLWMSEVAIYLIVNILISLRLSRSMHGEDSAMRRLSVLTRLFVTFPTIHISWAAGFFRRLLQRQRTGIYWGN